MAVGACNSVQPALASIFSIHQCSFNGTLLCEQAVPNSAVLLFGRFHGLPVHATLHSITFINWLEREPQHTAVWHCGQ